MSELQPWWEVDPPPEMPEGWLLRYNDVETGAPFLPDGRPAIPSCYEGEHLPPALRYAWRRNHGNVWAEPRKLRTDWSPGAVKDFMDMIGRE